MISFTVQDMSCGHCVRSITQAVQALDAQAQVSVDLASHQVSIQSATATTQQLQQAIEEAGYTAVAAEPAPAPAARSGCGGGACCCAH